MGACNRFYFCEQISGIPRFCVESDLKGGIPIRSAASLLAMHCFVTGKSPQDYIVMVRAQGTQFEALLKQAEKLLRIGQRLRSGVCLTRRQTEILDGVLHQRTNKEIASILNLSERTIKFHMSSLLAKFKVRSRMELVGAVSNHVLQTLPNLSPRTGESRQSPVAVPRHNAGASSDQEEQQEAKFALSA